VRWRRLSLSALLSGAIGRDVWNVGRQYQYLSGLSEDLDQRGTAVETAKPVGYYGLPGLSGPYYYPNSHFVESASYARLREVAVSWDLGPIGSLGAWNLCVTARNLATFASYHGFDPEVPYWGETGLNGVDAFAYPQMRTVGASLSVRF